MERLRLAKSLRTFFVIVRRKFVTVRTKNQDWIRACSSAG
jgi:hypothetical protein